MPGLAAPQLNADLPVTENGDPILTLDEETTEEGMPQYDPLAPNLAIEFDKSDEGKEELDEIATEVIRMFDADWRGLDGWRKWVSKVNKLYAGELPPKEAPWENAANPHVPILLENTTRIHARVSSELFGNYSNICSVPPMGDMFENEAEIVETHTNWQLREQIPDFARQMDRGLQNFILLGDVTIHSTYDVEERRNRHDTLSADEFVVPYGFTSVMPDYGDCHHYTRVLRYYKHQIQAMRGAWLNVDEVLEEKASWEDEPETPVRQGQAEVTGEDMPSDLAGDAPYTLLHWEGWLELPLQDRDRWCQVIVDRRTKRILSLKIHEEADWQDKARFEQQQQELNQYRDSQAQYAQMMQQYQAQADQANQAGQLVQHAHAHGLMPADHVVQAMGNAQQMMPPPPPPPPPPPQWVDNPEDLQDIQFGPEPAKMVPIRMFIHGVCFEPMTGTIGVGIGRVLADYNRAANIALSQFTDAASLANSSGLIVAGTVDFERKFSWAPGTINKANGVAPSELQSAIKEMKPAPANPQLLQLVQMMQANGQAAAQAPDVLSGEPGKSGETYRGIATRVEQATKQLSVIGMRFANVVKWVLRNNAKLNATFLREEELFMATQDNLKTMGQIRVTRDMYQRGYKFEIVADMTFASKAERIQEADQIAQMWTAFAPLGQNPGSIGFLQLALTECLKARGKREFIPQLGPQVPPPQTPFGMPPPGMPPPGAPPPGGPPHPGGPPAKPPASGNGGPPQPPAAQNPPKNAPGPGGPVGAPPPEAPHP